MRKILLLLTLALGGFVFGQSSLNMSLLGRATYMNDNSDIWGYTDSVGTEYALVGTTAGVSIVDISGNQPQKNSLFKVHIVYGVI